jgi:8-oxo-dGTP pyrophosphatase MutT (NUDIX family)
LAFDLPRGVILPVEAVEVRLEPEPHPFELEFPDEIEANWQSAKAANPALYDGRIAFHAHLALRDGRLVGSCHEARYATFLYWRDRHGAVSAEHAYAHAALVSSDNALVAVRMASWTANAGTVYFAAGSFEPEDFPGGMVDVDANMIREVREETGLDITGLRRDPAYHIYSRAGGTAIIRRYYLAETADIVADRIREFVASEVKPEIDEPVVIRSADDLPNELKPHMVEIVRWHFGQS